MAGPCMVFNYNILTSFVYNFRKIPAKEKEGHPFSVKINLSQLRIAQLKKINLNIPEGPLYTKILNN